MKCAALALSLLMMCSVCRGQASEKAQEIQKLLTAMDSMKNIEAVWDTTIPQMRTELRQMISQGLERDKGEKPENIDAVVGMITDEFRKQLHGQDVIDRIIVPLYEQYFSAEEVHQLRLFYESPTGKKLTTLQPQFVPKMLMEAQKLAQEAIGRVLANPEFRNKVEAILRGETPK